MFHSLKLSLLDKLDDQRGVCACKDKTPEVKIAKHFASGAAEAAKIMFCSTKAAAGLETSLVPTCPAFISVNKYYTFTCCQCSQENRDRDVQG